MFNFIKIVYNILYNQ